LATARADAPKLALSQGNFYAQERASRLCAHRLCGICVNAA
jgi:hypothetical protein